MSPDLASAARGGIVCLVTAILACAGLLWWLVDGRPEVDARLEAARTAAKSITGQEPLRQRVEKQREANTALRDNIATLKAKAGFSRSPEFTLSPDEKEPGKFFSQTYTAVRQDLVERSERQRIKDYDQDFGFVTQHVMLERDKAQDMLDRLQLTRKVVEVVLNAPEPVEMFRVKNDDPIATGPVSRPVLLREYPLTLTVRGSLKAILAILHGFGIPSERETGPKFPLIVTSLTISAENSVVRDDISQLNATFGLAAMAFIDEREREAAPATATAGEAGWKARP